MDSISSFTKFLFGFIVLIAISLLITSIVPPDEQGVAEDTQTAECVGEIC